MTMKKFIILMFILIFMRPHEILWDLTNISVEISIKPHLDLVWDLMRSHENLRWDLLHILIWDLMRSYWDHMRFSSHEISMRSQMRFSHGTNEKSKYVFFHNHFPRKMKALYSRKYCNQYLIAYLYFTVFQLVLTNCFSMVLYFSVLKIFSPENRGKS